MIIKTSNNFKLHFIYISDFINGNRNFYNAKHYANNNQVFNVKRNVINSYCTSIGNTKYYSMFFKYMWEGSFKYPIFSPSCLSIYLSLMVEYKRSIRNGKRSRFDSWRICQKTIRYT